MLKPLSFAGFEEKYGKVPWSPIPGKREIKINPEWERENIQFVQLLSSDYSFLQAARIPFYKEDNAMIWRGGIRCHKDTASIWLQLFNELHKRNLLRYIITYSGGFNPRLTTGGNTPSMHTIFSLDVNAEWNPYGQPATHGKGTLYPLDDLLTELGLTRLVENDGMHIQLGVKI